MKTISTDIRSIWQLRNFCKDFAIPFPLMLKDCLIWESCRDIIKHSQQRMKMKETEEHDGAAKDLIAFALKYKLTYS